MAKRRDVSIENGIAGVARPYVDQARVASDPGTRRQTDQIVRIGKGMRVVEVVDAPRQATFRVAPGAEAVNVQIADGEDARGAAVIGDDRGIELRPPIVGAAQEGEEVVSHAGVLVPQRRRDDWCLSPQPALVLPRRLMDVH